MTTNYFSLDGLSNSLKFALDALLGVFGAQELRYKVNIFQ